MVAPTLFVHPEFSPQELADLGNGAERGARAQDLPVPRDGAGRCRVRARWRPSAAMSLLQPNAARSVFFLSRSPRPRAGRGCLPSAPVASPCRFFLRAERLCCAVGRLRSTQRSTSRWARARARPRSAQVPAGLGGGNRRNARSRRISILPGPPARVAGSMCRRCTAPPGYGGYCRAELSFGGEAGVGLAIAMCTATFSSGAGRCLCAARQPQPSGKPKSLAACVGLAASSRNSPTARNARGVAGSLGPWQWERDVAMMRARSPQTIASSNKRGTLCARNLTRARSTRPRWQAGGSRGRRKPASV